MGVEEANRELREMKRRSRAGGGADKQEKHHKQGKMTARERIDALLDPGSFVEFDAFGDAPVLSLRHGQAQGPGRWGGHRPRHHRRPPGVRLRPGFHRFRRFRGQDARAEDCKMYDFAVKTGAPIIGIYDWAAPHQEGADSAVRLRRDILPERPRIGRDTADRHGHGALHRGASCHRR